MRIVGAVVLGAVLFGAAPAPAQVVDLSTVKCKEFLESGKDTIAMLTMWLSGYYTDQDASAVVDFSKIAEKVKELGAYCGKNPAHGLITAAEEVMKD